MTRRSTQRPLLAPLPPPAPPAPTPRAAWDALLASLPLTDEQRTALTVAADDIAIEAAQEVASEVSRIAHEVGNAALHGCHGITAAAERAVVAQMHGARARLRAAR
jgi:hypothetical protein